MRSGWLLSAAVLGALGTVGPAAAKPVTPLCRLVRAFARLPDPPPRCLTLFLFSPPNGRLNTFSLDPADDAERGGLVPLMVAAKKGRSPVADLDDVIGCGAPARHPEVPPADVQPPSQVVALKVERRDLELRYSVYRAGSIPG